MIEPVPCETVQGVGFYRHPQHPRLGRIHAGQAYRGASGGGGNLGQQLRPN